MRFISRTSVVVLLLLTLCLPLRTLAWGTEGHQVIASLAERQLTPKARAEVQRLLDLEPGSTLTSISTWADEHRNPATAAWHYVNFPRDTCSYVAERDCPDGQCVVAAIDRQAKTLGSSAPDRTRLTALKYIVHFVADVHQPLHAGYGDDRGGNSYQVQAFGRGSNLHVVWDSGLIKNLNEDVAALTTRLAATPVTDSSFNAVNAAQDSCRIVASPGFYPDRFVNDAYLKKFTPVMEQQLAAAGARLATLLNALLR